MPQIYVQILSPHFLVSAFHFWLKSSRSSSPECLRTVLGVRILCLIESSWQSKDVLVLIFPFRRWIAEALSKLHKLICEEKDRSESQERKIEVCTQRWPKYDLIFFITYSIFPLFSLHHVLNIFPYIVERMRFSKDISIFFSPKVLENQILLNIQVGHLNV